MPQTQTFVYAFLKPWVKIGARLFFSDIRLIGRENLPTNRPVILVANHQNAMLDPVVICLFTSKQLHWLTRADVFKKPSVSAFLHKLNMLPVYRERDRVSDLADRNGKTFEICYERLNANAVVCLFPEGTHRGKKQLVLPLKKGTARMALNAVASGVNDLCIVPVGLDYENYYTYRKALVIHFGEPIEVKASDLANERVRQQADLTNEMTAALKKLMIHIDSEDVYHEIIGLKPLCDKASGAANAEESFRSFKKLSDFLDQHPEEHHWLRHEVHRYLSLSHELGIHEEYYDERLNRSQKLMTLLGLICSIPAACIFYPIYSAAEGFVRKVVKDPLFKNSIRVTLWTFLTPFWILLVSGIAGVLGMSILKILVMNLALVLSSIIALNSWPGFKKIRQSRLIELLKSKNDSRYLDWLGYRERIFERIKLFIH